MAPSRSPLPAALSRRALLGWSGAAMMTASAWPLPALAAHVTRPWPAAKPVPALDLADLDGRRWQLGPLLGQVVVINFWATWCEPCRKEMPSLEAMSVQRRHEGVAVAAVNFHEPAELIRSFLAKLPFKVPVLLDTDGDATGAWTPRVFPSTVLVGRDGRPVLTVLGDLDWQGADARALLEPLIAAPRKAS